MTTLPEFVTHLLALQEFLGGGPLSAKQDGKYLRFFVGDREVQAVTLGE